MNFKKFAIAFLCIFCVLTCSSCGIHLDLSMSNDTPSSQEDIPPSQEKPSDSNTDKNDPSEKFSVTIDPDLTGVWLTEVDLSEVIQNELTKEADATMVQYLDFDQFSFTVGLCMTFTKDGRVVCTADKEISRQSIDKLTGFLTEGMTTYLRAIIEEEATKHGMTSEQYFTAAGIEDGEAYIHSTVQQGIEEADLASIQESIEESLHLDEYYGVKGDRLYMYEKTPDENDYMLYSVTKGQFLLDASLSDKLDADMPNGLKLPLVFNMVTE